MLYEDRMAVATPEGVTLEFTLAGVGSRLIAGLLDVLVQGAIGFAIWLITMLLALVVQEWALAFAALAFFLLLFGYDITFETLGSGRTPGKRWTGLRVVQVGGGPVTFRASAVRNLLRMVDALPFAYVVGIVAITATEKNQRLGDLAAGTLVVRERTALSGQLSTRPAEAGSWSGWTSTERWLEPEGEEEAAAQFVGWDVSAVTAEEVATVRQFLARRQSLDPQARRHLALELANRLRPKVMAPDERMGPEGFLEKLLAAKSERW